MFVKDMTLSQIKEKYPEAHQELLKEAKAEVMSSAEISALKDENVKLAREFKIYKACAKAGCVEKAVEFSASTMSVEDVCMELLSQPKKVESISTENSTVKEGSMLSKVFKATAPESAGTNSGEIVEVTDQKSAEEYVSKKYNLTKRGEIVKKARREFPKLYDLRETE